MPWEGRGPQGHGAGGIARSPCAAGGGARSAAGTAAPGQSRPLPLRCGRGAPRRGGPSVPWGHAWVGAGAPRGGMWVGRGRSSGTGLRHSQRSAAAQHGREARDPALRQGEDPHGAAGRGCRCLRVPRSPALPSASERCHGRPGGCIGARRLSSAFARRRARTGRAWGTAPSASGSSWCCCSKERPSPSPPWTRRGERCSATRCRSGDVGWDSPAPCTGPGGAGRSHYVGKGLRTLVVPPGCPPFPKGGRRTLLGQSCHGTHGAGAVERLILLLGTGPGALQRASAASSLLQGTGCAEGLCARRSAARSALQRRLQDRYSHHRGLPGGQAGTPRVSGWHCPEKG